MTLRQLVWMVCFLADSSLAGCEMQQPARSAKELETKIDELTKQVETLHGLLSQQELPTKPEFNLDSPSWTSGGASGVEKATLNRPTPSIATVPFFLLQVTDKKVLLDFRGNAAKPSTVEQQLLNPFLQHLQADFDPLQGARNSSFGSQHISSFTF